MKRLVSKSVLAAFFACSSFSSLAIAQTTGGTQGSFGGGITTGGTSSFGPTMTGSGSTSGGTSGSGTSTSGNIFQPTTSYFGNYSYGRTPFGSNSYLRGPASANGLGGWNGSSTSANSRTSTTARGTTTGLGGAGGLGGLGGLAGGLNRNRNMNMNQNTQQNKVRTRLSATIMRGELGTPPIPATKFVARLERLPNAVKFKDANVAVQGRTAIIDAPKLAAADIERLGQLLLLEPGIDNFEVAGQTDNQPAANVPTSISN